MHNKLRSVERQDIGRRAMLGFVAVSALIFGISRTASSDGDTCRPTIAYARSDRPSSGLNENVPVYDGPSFETSLDGELEPNASVEIVGWTYEDSPSHTEQGTKKFLIVKDYAGYVAASDITIHMMVPNENGVVYAKAVSTPPECENRG